ncbi:MAG: glycosyltransferase, partial [Bryobacteraceae bacterium]
VIPSRDGRALLERALPGIRRELEGIESEVIIVDNGSVEGALLFPGVRIVTSEAPLSFARAVNLGLGEARFSHVCLLNNDMEVQPGFFRELRLAFAKTPDLFCATAQILFPEGARRQETGKAVMPGAPSTDFPVRCEEPLPGEDGTWVLYGSGGCSLYDAAKLRSLAGLGEIFEPAYVEDLDAGFRAWQRGWPSVYTAGARVVHHHRATTSRFFTPEELERMVEVNYLRFLAQSVASPATFRQLWRMAIARLNTLAARMQPPAPAVAALRMACRAPFWHALPAVVEPPEEAILALGSGLVSVFPGKASRGRPIIVVAAPYPPFPLSHGGAVRMYNLMREAAAGYDQVLICFVEEAAAPPAELLELCAEIVVVRRRGTHILADRGRPDVVEEFDAPAFAEALRQTVRRWRPFAVQLEFTQMAQYAADCAPAHTILVEHDVTFDLCRQMLAVEEDWEMRRQYERWRVFESDAWKRVSAVVVMSEKDRKTVGLSPAVVIPNGVDLDRFTPSPEEPESARVLFIGSFA